MYLLVLRGKAKQSKLADFERPIYLELPLLAADGQRR